MAEWPLLAQSATFGVIVALMVAGIIGIFVPLVPGTLIIWLAALVYALADGFRTLGPWSFAAITLIAVVSSTADWWLPLIGAQTGGADRRSLVAGALGAAAGAIAGTFVIVGTLPGALLGYALGIFWSQYRRHGDWEAALKASLGGLAGWGLAMAIQLGGAILMVLIFVGRVLVG